MKYDVEIPKSSVNKLVRILLLLTGVTGLIVLGYLYSPIGENGMPRLLSPRLAQVTRYQHDAQRWTGELNEIQNGFADVLANQGSDLLYMDSHANTLYGRLAALQTELDGTKVPPTLAILHDAIQESIDQSMLAASRTIAWIGEPTIDNHTSALDALTNAKSILDRVYENPWMQEQP